MCKLLHSFFVYILHSIQTYLQFVLYVCYMQLHWPKSKLDRVLSLGEPWVFNLQRRSKCRRGKEEEKGAQKESSKYKREGGEGSKKNEKGNDVSHDGMEGCLCVRLLQVGENLDSVEWTSDRKQSVSWCIITLWSFSFQVSDADCCCEPFWSEANKHNSSYYWTFIHIMQCCHEFTGRRNKWMDVFII